MSLRLALPTELNRDQRAALATHGSLILRSAVDADEPALQREALACFARLARIVEQYRDGTVVHRVEDRGADAQPRTYYSHGAAGGDLHTDGTYMHLVPPDLVGLFCVRPADHGGDSLLVDGHALIDALSPAARRALARPHHFDTDGQVPDCPTLSRPIIADSAPARRIHYLRQYIEAGHATAHTPLDRASVDAMDELDALAAARRQPIRLRAGELLLIDNHRMLHGRTGFADAPGSPRRLLLRLWGNRCC